MKPFLSDAMVQTVRSIFEKSSLIKISALMSSGVLLTQPNVHAPLKTYISQKVSTLSAVFSEKSQDLQGIHKVYAPISSKSSALVYTHTSPIEQKSSALNQSFMETMEEKAAYGSKNEQMDGGNEHTSPHAPSFITHTSPSHAQDFFSSSDHSIHPTSPLLLRQNSVQKQIQDMNGYSLAQKNISSIKSMPHTFENPIYNAFAPSSNQTSPFLNKAPTTNHSGGSPNPKPSSHSINTSPDTQGSSPASPNGAQTPILPLSPLNTPLNPIHSSPLLGGGNPFNPSSTPPSNPTPPTPPVTSPPAPSPPSTPPSLPSPQKPDWGSFCDGIATKTNNAWGQKDSELLNTLLFLGAYLKDKGTTLENGVCSGKTISLHTLLETIDSRIYMELNRKAKAAGFGNLRKMFSKDEADLVNLKDAADVLGTLGLFSKDIKDEFEAFFNPNTEAKIKDKEDHDGSIFLDILGELQKNYALKKSSSSSKKDNDSLDLS
jgi:hypothetical protein